MALPAKLQADVNFRRGLAAAAGVSVLALAAIVIFLLSQALPIFAHVSLKDFLFSTEWYPTDEPPVFGIGALIAGSLACAALTTLIAVPFGVLTACAIHAGMPPALTRIVKPLIELMAALPSVVIGFIGMIILAPWLQDMFGIATGLNLFNASIMLAFMCVPTIASISEDALRNVPSGLREASLALGATRWETLLKVELRWAMGGIATAVMLGISRVIGDNHGCTHGGRRRGHYSRVDFRPGAPDDLVDRCRNGRSSRRRRALSRALCDGSRALHHYICLQPLRLVCGSPLRTGEEINEVSSFAALL